MGFHYDTLKDFVRYMPKRLNLPAMPHMDDYLDRVFKLGYHIYLPQTKADLSKKDDFDIDAMIQEFVAQNRKASLEKKLVSLPYDVLMIEDPESVVILDQEDYPFRASFFAVSNNDVVLGSARFVSPEHVNDDEFAFSVKKPIYFNYWHKGVSLTKNLPEDQSMVMAMELMNSTVIALHELMYLKINDQL